MGPESQVPLINLQYFLWKVHSAHRAQIYELISVR